MALSELIKEIERQILEKGEREEEEHARGSDNHRRGGDNIGQGDIGSVLRCAGGEKRSTETNPKPEEVSGRPSGSGGCCKRDQAGRNHRTD